MTNPVKWKNKEIYDIERHFMTDVRLAYTRATILTAVLKSEKDEKVKKNMKFWSKTGMGQNGSPSPTKQRVWREAAAAKEGPKTDSIRKRTKNNKFYFPKVMREPNWF